MEETQQALAPVRTDQLDFELLLLLSKEPDLSQRELATRLGISLGKVNYCLKSLFAVGAIKLDNFHNSRNKMRYAYALTPVGLARKAALMHVFLQRKVAEYERLKAQIKVLEDDLTRDEGI